MPVLLPELDNARAYPVGDAREHYNPNEELLWIGEELNGHVGKENTRKEHMMAVCGYGNRDEG